MVQVIGRGTIECKHAPFGNVERLLLAQKVNRIRRIVIRGFEKRIFTLAQAQVRAVGIVGFGVRVTRHVFQAVFFLVRDTLRFERKVVRNPQNAGRLGRSATEDRGLLDHHDGIAVLVRNNRCGRRPHSAAHDQDICLVVPLTGFLGPRSAQRDST